MTIGRTFDAAIVGAGIIGAACARALARDGLSVLVVDEAFCAAGTTSAAMGHIVVMDDSPAELALTAWSRRLWTELADELPPACEDERRGTLWIAASPEELPPLEAKRDLYVRAGVPASILDERALRAAEPALRPGLAGALFVEGDGVLYPPAAARWMLDRARTGGAVVRQRCRVERIERGTVVLRGEAATAERVSAGIIVNAAGIGAPRLTPELPVIPRKGHLAITDRYPGLCHSQLVELGYLHSAHTLGGASTAFNVQPRATGQVLIGSSRELVGRDASVNPRLLRAMLARAVEFIPALAGCSVIRVWTGFRPATPDSLPLIGPWPETPGLWIATGHEGLGITTATGTAELVAAGVAGRATPIDAAPYDPARVLRAEAHAV